MNSIVPYIYFFSDWRYLLVCRLVVGILYHHHQMLCPSRFCRVWKGSHLQTFKSKPYRGFSSLCWHVSWWAVSKFRVYWPNSFSRWRFWLEIIINYKVSKLIITYRSFDWLNVYFSFYWRIRKCVQVEFMICAKLWYEHEL